MSENEEIGYERFRIIEGLLRELVANTAPAFAKSESGGIPKSWRCERCRAALGTNESHRDKDGNFSCEIPLPPKSESEAKVDPGHVVYVCPNCNKQTVSKQQHEHGNLTGDGAWWSCQPAQPESEAKVCPNCARKVPTFTYHKARNVAGGVPSDQWKGDGYTCQPASPEPAAPSEMPECELPAEMPQDVALAVLSLHNCKLFDAADRLRDWWRTHAQPVGITEELERVLLYARARVQWRLERWPEITSVTDAMEADIAAVRSHYGSVKVAPRPKLEKVRAFLHRATTMYTNPEGDRMLRAALAELDEAEGVTK